MKHKQSNIKDQEKKTGHTLFFVHRNLNNNVDFTVIVLFII